MSVSFRWDKEHHVATCRPVPGKIRGVFSRITAPAGKYRIAFLNADKGDALIARTDVDLTTVRQKPVNCGHNESDDHDPFQRNVRLRVTFPDGSVVKRSKVAKCLAARK